MSKKDKIKIELYYRMPVYFKGEETEYSIDTDLNVYNKKGKKWQNSTITRFNDYRKHIYSRNTVDGSEQSTAKW